jgi:hypothetical protein
VLHPGNVVEERAVVVVVERKHAGGGSQRTGKQEIGKIRREEGYGRGWKGGDEEEEEEEVKKIMGENGRESGEWISSFPLNLLECFSRKCC